VSGQGEWSDRGDHGRGVESAWGVDHRLGANRVGELRDVCQHNFWHVPVEDGIAGSDDIVALVSGVARAEELQEQSSLGRAAFRDPKEKLLYFFPPAREQCP